LVTSIILQKVNVASIDFWSEQEEWPLVSQKETEKVPRQEEKYSVDNHEKLTTDGNM